MKPTIITDLAGEILDMPLTEPFAIATGAQQAALNVLVRITLADGTTGIGEAAPFAAVSGETQASSLAAVEGARAAIVGQDARAWRRLATDLAERFPHEAAARAGIEVAILDAWSCHHRVPLWSFFGGAGTELTTDMTVTVGNAAHAASAAEAIVARGIGTIKVKVGGKPVDEDVERMVAIHRVAPEAWLLADANGGYTAGQAIDFLQRLAAAGVSLRLFEQPVDRDDPGALAAVTAQSGGVLICADESVRSAREVLAIAREGAAHGINIKLMKCGVAESLAMWSVARAAGLSLMIGGMVESVLAMSFSAHFAAGLGGFSYVDLDTPMFIREHPFRGGFRQNGERLDVSDVSAGHGVVLRPRG